MKRVLTICWRNLKRNAGSLLLFEILYRIPAFCLIYFMAECAVRFSLEQQGYSYMTAENYIQFIRHPVTLLLVALCGIVVLAVLFLELMALFTCFEASWRREKCSAADMFTKGAVRMVRFLRKRPVFWIIGLLGAVPAVHLYLIISESWNLRLLSVTIQKLYSAAPKKGIFLAACIVVTVCSVIYAYQLPYLFAEGERFREFKLRAAGMWRNGWKQILLSLTGWTSVGNSNWFIFAILVMYLFSWAALRLIPSRVGQLCAVTALSAAYAVVFHHYYPDIWWWYDTILCYATGMWFAFFRPQIERFLSGELRFWVSFGALLVLFRVLFYYRNSLAVYEALAVVFCLLGVLVSMKVKVGNRVLDWLGRQVFTVYILQRLPMMLLEQWGLSAYPYAFFAASLALTLGLAAGFDWLLKRFDRYVLKIPEKK